MSKKDATPSVAQVIEDIRRVASALGRAPQKAEYFQQGKFQEWQTRKLFHGFSDALKAAGFEPTIIRIGKLESENKRLTEELEEMRGEMISAHHLRQMLGTVDMDLTGRGAEWLKGPKGSKLIETTGVPMLCASDWHFDEVIKAEQIEFSNEYNHAIAVDRINHLFRRTVELLKRHMVKPKYEGIIFGANGDLLSGNIHDELRETNAQVIGKSIFSLADLMVCGIGLLADEFGKVFVPWTVGNHGRMDHKPRAKNGVQDNFEWIVANIVARAFKNDPRVSFLISESFDCQFAVYDKTIRQTHGDQFRGGSGISGVFTPLMLGMSRKQARQQAVKNPFDVMWVGHFHQYIHTNSLIMNGSLCGYNEYSYKCNFKSEPPQQALFVVNRENGITFRMPVLCNGYGEKAPVPSRPALQW